MIMLYDYMNGFTKMGYLTCGTCFYDYTIFFVANIALLCFHDVTLLYS